MSIKNVTDKTKPTEPVAEQKPLLNITLPAPMSGDPNSPLTVGEHNNAAMKNFSAIGDILKAMVNNEKMLGSALNKTIERVNELEKAMKKLTENILKENDKKPKPTATK